MPSGSPNPRRRSAQREGALACCCPREEPQGCLFPSSGFVSSHYPAPGGHSASPSQWFLSWQCQCCRRFSLWSCAHRLTGLFISGFSAFTPGHLLPSLFGWPCVLSKIPAIYFDQLSSVPLGEERKASYLTRWIEKSGDWLHLIRAYTNPKQNDAENTPFDGFKVKFTYRFWAAANSNQGPPPWAHSPACPYIEVAMESLFSLC